jgi:hypothetical protein
MHKAVGIFVEEYPVLNKVPMVFYLPPSNEKADTKAIIEKYGGHISEVHECHTYQIAPMQVDLPRNNYFFGDVFSAHWIINSIKAGQLLDQTDYLAFENDEKNIKRIEFTSARTQFTIMEGIKIFSLALSDQVASSGAAFWLKIERQNLI